MHYASDTSTTPTAPSASRISPLRLVLVVVMVAIAVGILSVAMTGNSAANRDFICYWAAGHQLVHHQNPYDGPAILVLERSAGYRYDRPFFMRNPPSAFFVALPLGLLSARLGAVLWSLVLIGALMGSIQWNWHMLGRPAGRTHLIGYVFPPALSCLLAGQIGLFLLLGVSLFLRYHKTRPFLAGTALLVTAVKPHIFLPLMVVVFLWCLTARRYLVIAGFVLASSAACVLGFAADPAGWTQYARMMAAENLRDELIPTTSFMFRFALHPAALWLQFVPVAVACVWATWYFWSRREHWDWLQHGCLLLLVSVLVAPYAWLTDEAVVLPAILAGLYTASNRVLLAFECIACLALLEVLCGVVVNSGFYVWTAPAWLVWYLYAVRGAGRVATADTSNELATNASTVG